jgi:translocation and assembly module TamB
MKKRKIAAAAIIAACCLSIVAAAFLYRSLPGFLATARQEIIQQANEKLNGALYLDEVRLSGFLQITADNVRIEDKDGRPAFQAASVSARVSLLGLLFKQKSPTEAISSITVAEGGKFFLSMDKEQKWNVGQLLKPSEDKELPFYAKIRLPRAEVHLKLPQGDWLFSLSGDVDAAANPKFSLNFSARQGGNLLKLSGNFDLDGNGGLRLISDCSEAAPYAPLLQEAIGLAGLSGQVRDVDLAWGKKGKADVFNGQARLASLSGSKTLAGNDFSFVLDGGLGLRGNKLDFSGFAAKVNGQELSVSGGLFFEGAGIRAENLAVAARKFNPAQILAAVPWQGDVSFSATLDGPLEPKLDKLHLQGQASFAEAKVGQILLRDGEADFSYREGRLFVKGANFGVLGGKADFSGEYDHAGGFLAGQAKIEGADLAKIPGMGDFSGKANGQAVFYGQPSWEGLRAVAVASAATAGFRSLKIGDLNVCLEQAGGATTLQYASGSVGQGHFNAYGALSGQEAELNFAAGGLPLGELAALAGMEGQGRLNVRGVLRGNWPDVSGEAEIEAADGVLAKQPFNSLAGKITLAEKTIGIEDLLLKMDCGLHFANGSVNIGAAVPLFDLKVVSKDVRLEPLAAFALPGEKVTGNMDSLAVIRGSMDRPEISGEILIHEASFRDYFVEKVSGRYFYADKAASFRDFSLKFMQTSVFFDGRADLGGNISLNFSGDNIRLENLPQYEGIKLHGGVALKGTLSGNIAKPVFSGEIKADGINVNGEELNNVQGTAFSEAGLDNYVMVNFASGGGEYSLDAGLNFNERFAHCHMEIKNGNIKSLLAAAGYKLDIDGSLDGSLEMNPGGKRTGIALRAQVNGGRIRGVAFETIDLDLHMRQGKVVVRKFDARQGGGRIAGKGEADFLGDIVDLEFGGAGVDASILTAFMQEPVDFQGKLNFLLQAGGSAQDPEISASVQISPGSVQNISFDDLYGLFNIKDDILTLNQLFVAKGAHKISVYGKAPLDLLRKADQRYNKDSQLDLVVELNESDLSIIPNIFSGQTEWGMGKTEGRVALKGTLEEPRFYGSFAINGGVLKFRHLYNPLDKINIAVNFAGDKVILENFSAVMGKGSLRAVGSVDLGGGSEYKLELAADKLGIASEIFTGPVTFDFAITPHLFRNRSRPLAKGNILLENILVNLPVVPEFGEGTSNLGLDVNVRIGEKVRLYNKYLYDMLLEGNLHITGSTVFPNVAGAVKVKTGTIKYLGSPFKVDSGTASFPLPGSVIPHIALSARSRISSVDVNVGVTGPLTEMDVKLSSNPPLPQQGIFRLITLKTTGSSSSMTEDDARGLLSAGLQMTLFGNVEDFLRDVKILDELRIYQGAIGAGTGMLAESMLSHDAVRESREQYNFYVGKYLTDRLLISYAGSFNYDESRLSMQYDLGRRLRLGVAIDEKEKMYYGLEYRISF